MRAIFGIGALAAVLLAGCGADSGAEYIGKWQNTKFKEQTLIIERNGDGIMIRHTSPSLVTGTVKTNSFPATLKDGNIEVSSAFGSAIMTIDKKSGYLTGGGDQYKKLD